MSSAGNASVRQLELPLDDPGDEAVTGTRGEDAPGDGTDLLARVLEVGNLRRALPQVRRHQGAPGIDGRTVDDLGEYLKPPGPRIQAAVREGTYAPQPVRRPAIPQPGGGTRHLGLPPVLDRFSEHALLPVLQAAWDPTCSERSDGFRPQRNAHQAVERAQAYSRAGDPWVVDLDLEKVFDRVNHDVLRSRGRRRVKARRVLTLIHRCLKAGVLTLEGSVEPTADGTPHGGPLSPRLANLRLDELDKALEKRGHRFARDADEANISVRSRQAGERGMASVRRLLERQLRLKVNEAKRAVDRPWSRTFLGVTFTRRPSNRRNVSGKALKAFTAKVRAITGRTRGRTIRQIGQELRQWMLGWRAFFGCAEVRSPLRELDQWSRRRLRSDHWQPWGRRGYRELRKRGVGRQLAWNTAKSAQGPWRLSQRPALAIALPQRDVAARGLPSLREDCPPTESAEPPDTCPVRPVGWEGGGREAPVLT